MITSTYFVFTLIRVRVVAKCHLHMQNISHRKKIVMRICRIKIFLDFYAITLKTIQLIKFMENSLWQLIIIESLQTELRGHSNNT